LVFRIISNTSAFIVEYKRNVQWGEQSKVTPLVVTYKHKLTKKSWRTILHGWNFFA
jgi:hypothetical protein